MSRKLTTLVEEILVAYLQALVSGTTVLPGVDASVLSGVAILPGHRSATLNAYGTAPEEELNPLVITATRPRRWISDEAHYEMDVQFRKESQADAVSLAAHDAVVELIESVFGLEHFDAVKQWIQANAVGFGLVGFEMDESGESEARDAKRGRHGDALPFVFWAYYA